MTTKEFLEAMDHGIPVEGGSELHLEMHRLSQEALRLTMEINTKYHAPEELTALFAELTGRVPGEGFGFFPPFFTDCGKNIHVGKRVFINSGCKFQDQGGIYIGDESLIGHNVVIATLNHFVEPERRSGMTPKAVRIGRRVWIGSNSTILPGVTIGDNAIVGAGSVVTRDVPANAVAVGNPARVKKFIS